jgi:methylenetetrahydrofolate reductase (NADPH)
MDDFNIFVGAYPNIHPEAKDISQDIEWLKRKLDVGASDEIMQFFFQAGDFFRFRDAYAKTGINAPIVPGILSIENWENTKKFAACCGAQIPPWMDIIYSKASRDDRSDFLSTALDTELCSKLLDGGVTSLNFYTLIPV